MTSSSGTEESSDEGNILLNMIYSINGLITLNLKEKFHII